jgi:hypothetical protein
MNIFLISPGRTGTHALSVALKHLDGFTSEHESKSNKLGEARLVYQNNHIESDNRLFWFIEKLTQNYGNTSILVIVNRDKEKIVNSYSKRWGKVNILKSYSQGILMRPLAENSTKIVRDYVNHVYDTLFFYQERWCKYIEIDIENPEEGMRDLLKYVDQENKLDIILSHLNEKKSNTSRGFIHRKLDALNFGLKLILWDLWKA